MASPPRALVRVTSPATVSLDAYLRTAGWVVDVSVSGTDPEPTEQEFLDGGYNFFGADARVWGVTGTMLNLAYKLYDTHGINVITTGNDTTFSTGNPIWTGAINAGGSVTPIVPAQSAHPLATSWTENSLDRDARIYLTGVRPTAEVVGYCTRQSDATLQPFKIAEESASGARYLHCEAAFHYTQASFREAAINWLTPGPAGLGRVWTGTSWEWKPVSVWNGTKWIKRPVKSFGAGSWANV